MVHRRRPNFFIAGAAKSGTSAMWRYLSTHPDIFFSRLKEPHFFASDLDDSVVRNPELTMDDYLSLFDDAGDAKVVGEASVHYLFSTARRFLGRDANTIAGLQHVLNRERRTKQQNGDLRPSRAAEHERRGP